MRKLGAIAVSAVLGLVLLLGGCRAGRCEWRGVAHTAAQREAAIRSRPG